MSSDLNPYELAGLATCASPDSEDSPGAEFLRSVQDQVNEAVRFWTDDDDVSDAAHDVADSCVPIYTYDLWRTFTDLAAWQEDVVGEFGPIEDMEQGAKSALYLIGYRVASELLEGGA